MKRKVFGLLLAALMLSVLVIPAAAGDPAQVSGFYDISSANVTAAASTGTVTPVTVIIGGKTVTVQNNSNQLKVAVPGAAAGVEYLVLLTDDKGQTVPTVTNEVYYIDQKTGAAGLEFIVYPKLDELTAATNLKLYVNGSDKSQVTYSVSYTPLKSYPTPDYIPGDVDNDGYPTATDALWCLQNSVGDREFSALQTSAGDVDHDGYVTATDALWILQASVGDRTL